MIPFLAHRATYAINGRWKPSMSYGMCPLGLIRTRQKNTTGCATRTTIGTRLLSTDCHLWISPRTLHVESRRSLTDRCPPPVSGGTGTSRYHILGRRVRRRPPTVTRSPVPLRSRAALNLKPAVHSGTIRLDDEEIRVFYSCAR